MYSDKIAVIQFPGSNCEYETQRAIAHYGLACDIVRWNTAADTLRQYGGFVLPGGFSYQDRIRSGAIAARLPILEVLFEANEAGKPILGICNGCQILCETGLVPQSQDHYSHSIEVALTHNEILGQRVGFKCEWTYVKVARPEQSLFTRYFEANEAIPIPINHGEGRFVLSENAAQMLNHVALFQYCDSQAQSTAASNPNGTTANIAGLANRRGNVFAIMPHPERAAFIKQIPDWLQSNWAQTKSTRLTAGETNGPWEKLFVAMRDHVLEAKVPA